MPVRKPECSQLSCALPINDVAEVQVLRSTVVSSPFFTYVHPCRFVLHHTMPASRQMGLIGTVEFSLTPMVAKANQ